MPSYPFCVCSGVDGHGQRRGRTFPRRPNRIIDVLRDSSLRERPLEASHRLPGSFRKQERNVGIALVRKYAQPILILPQHFQAVVAEYRTRPLLQLRREPDRRLRALQLRTSVVRTTGQSLPQGPANNIISRIISLSVFLRFILCFIFRNRRLRCRNRRRSRAPECLRIEPSPPSP